MQKKHIVRLIEVERHQFTEVIKKLQGNSQKVRCAYILLQTDANGPNWTDLQIAQAYHCRTKTVENIRQRFVEEGLERLLANHVVELGIVESVSHETVRKLIKKRHDVASYRLLGHST